MNENNQRNRGPKQKSNSSSGNRGNNSGNKNGKQQNKQGNQQGNKQGNKKKGRTRGKKNQSSQPNIDPKRPIWENPEAEAEVLAIVGSVRPAHNPTALVRSLGSPPLGTFADNAQHYYDAVYEKAQRLAIATATANNLLVEDQTTDNDTH